MANLIIKSSADNLVLQGSDASPAITVGATGTTTFAENATFSGTANVYGAGTFPAGMITKYERTLSTGPSPQDSTSSYVDVTGFTQAITPTAASSKILVMLSCQVQTNPSGTYNGQCDMSINRSIDGGSYTAIAAKNVGNYIQETYTSYHNNDCNITTLDSPSYSLGNAITYKMQVKSADTSVTSKVNVSDGGVTNGATTLVLIEVSS